ncbi:integral membrane protein GPR137B-like isoform X5 [Mustela erminea]|uniref:integral membrane protein GPR137B-like isoform X5 n=1 Tax=Mustela erminea TaxID=36723 RepID=UPI0013874A26|nr:integral membrane protein GPR137B-like isoform X5 [Mustela erminea]
MKQKYGSTWGLGSQEWVKTGKEEEILIGSWSWSYLGSGWLKLRLPLYLASLFISLIFLLVNLTCTVLVKTGSWERKVIVSVHVAINDTLFVLCAVSLSVCLYKISKMSLANIYLESKAF